VEQLSTDLRVTFPGVSGFSTQNLWYMRQFYQEYSAAPKLQPLVGEIGWAHNLLILSRCKDIQGREFYLRMTRKFGWSKNVLAHQIDNQSYEKSLLGQTNFDQTLTPALRAQAKLAVKATTDCFAGQPKLFGIEDQSLPDRPDPAALMQYQLVDDDALLRIDHNWR
jgi:predicted nuclease of restriction endonuclease-like (RecB) superfamily